jgi:hypothetical protein
MRQKLWLGRFLLVSVILNVEMENSKSKSSFRPLFQNFYRKYQQILGSFSHLLENVATVMADTLLLQTSYSMTICVVIIGLP